MLSALDSKQEKVREVLIKTAAGSLRTHKARLISYKELWERISPEDWGRARVSGIVSLIVEISVFEIAHGRPPLNELVVRMDTGFPGHEWDGLKNYLEEKSGRKLHYLSHREAQEACWHYWGRTSDSNNTESEVEEGYQEDRSMTFRKRNALIIKMRKEKDDYTCQSCEFRLEVNGIFIIDCHHKHPLGQGCGVQVTGIDDLMCLCPICHRIAHTRKYPLEANEIRKLRGLSKRPVSRL